VAAADIIVRATTAATSPRPATTADERKSTVPAPLDGIKILDFTRFQNGPHGTAMLSDMGAEVLKVERPGDGDPMRSLGTQPDGFNAIFEACNRGKQSMTLNIKTPEAREIVYKLVEQVDVVVENFIPGVMDGLGIGYERLRTINPRLIYAINSGFGLEGEWSRRGCYDHVAQGVSGAMISLAGGPGTPPVKLGWGFADQVSSIVLAYAIMTALVARERFGLGQQVDVSLLGSMMTVQATAITGYLHTSEQPRTPLGGPGAATFSYHQAGDGEWFTDGVLTPNHWPKFCAALDRPDLVDDERSVDAWARAKNREWITQQVNDTFSTQPRQYWMDRFAEHDVPGGPVYDYAGLVENRQAWDNDYLIELDHPHFEGHRAVGIPVAFSETPVHVQGASPEVGQHTEEVLLKLGYSWKDIEGLRDSEVT
jgi:crotonobetainyl-CoA:carnitine CoA-transferase CaiB-like acyl-CoA transferase